MWRIFVLFLSVSIAYAEMQARLTHDDKEDRALIPGQLFEAVLRIWPHPSDADIQKYYDLKGHFLADYFYVVTVNRVEFSANNADVLEIFLTLILKEDWALASFLVWNYQGQRLPLTVRKFVVHKHVAAPQDFMILDQKLEQPFPWQYSWWLVGVLVFAALLLWRHKKYSRGPKTEKQMRQYWRDLFLQVSQRSEYEKIGSERGQWLRLLPVQTPGVLNFLKVLEEHQYRREWNDEIYLEVKNSFDEIKEIFRDGI